MPDVDIALAVSAMSCASTLHWNRFQEFQPIGGVAASVVQSQSAAQTWQNSPWVQTPSPHEQAQSLAQVQQFSLGLQVPSPHKATAGATDVPHAVVNRVARTAK